MPEGHKAERKRQQKQNIAAGIGDENGRIPHRIKADAQMVKCADCQQEMKITKTNTELKMHAENKHGKTLAVCFPEAEGIAKEMAAAVAGGGGKKGGKDGGKMMGGGGTKGKNKNSMADLDDLLAEGMSGGKKKGGKK